MSALGLLVALALGSLAVSAAGLAGRRGVGSNGKAGFHRTVVAGLGPGGICLLVEGGGIFFTAGMSGRYRAGILSALALGGCLSSLVGRRGAGATEIHREGLGTDLISSYLGGIAAPAALAAVLFSGTAWSARTLWFPLVVAAFGLAASMMWAAVARQGSDDSAKVFRRGRTVNSVSVAAGAFGVSVWLFGRVSGVEHPLGLWLAVVSGVLTAWGITSTSDWFTSDHFKAVKEVARQAQTGVPGVILSGLSAGLWAAVISFVLTSLGVAAAYGAGLWAIADGGGLYGLAVAAVGASAAVPMALTAIAGRRAGTEMDMDEGSRLAAETATALDADPRSFSLATATMTAVAFLAVLLSLDMGSGIHLATGVGLLLGVVLPFAVTGFLLIGAGRTLGPVESIMPAAGAVALTVILGFVDWVGLLAFLGGWLAVGFLLTTILLNAGMAWAAARSFVELGAFGGEGSSAHGWVVTAEALGRSLVQRSATSLTLELKVTMTLAVVLAGAGWPWPG